MSGEKGEPKSRIIPAIIYYHGLGLSLVLMKMRTKLPAWKWEPLQKKRASIQRLTEAFQRDSELGLGVIFGEISGGLASRDFDDMAAYEAWAAGYPELAATLPTVVTNRGMHVYCRTTPESVSAARAALGKQGGNGAISLGDGELRCGCGCYSVLPPSVHPSGHVYAWIVKPPKKGAKFPQADLLESGFTTCFVDPTQGDTSNTGNPREHKDTQVTKAIIAIVPSSLKNEQSLEWDEETIRKAIDRTVPDKTGIRNRRVFDLARELKGFFPDADPLDLEKYVQYWHDKAVEFINTKDFETTWLEFLRDWGNVKFAKGAGAMTTIVENAAARKLPECAMRFKNPKIQKLVAICRELQQESQDGTFYLSCRMAAYMVGTDHQKANLWLGVMVKNFKILELVELGQLEGRKASEYRYLGD